MNQSNLTELSFSNYLVGLTKQINFYTILIVILIGLASNFLTIIVFSQKRFRTNSSNVYLLVLAFVDSMFLVTHFFEDTTRIYEDLYINDDDSTKISTFDQLIHIINISNRIEIACRVVNYMRYVLRFVSAYIVVSFTLQRLFMVYRPLSISFKSNKSAWITIFSIVFISLLINSWTLFFFQLQYHSDSNRKYCDSSENFEKEYFLIVFGYVGLIVLIPILVIFVSNLLIISKMHKNKKRKDLQQIELINPESRSRTSKLDLSNTNLRTERHSHQIIILKKTKNSRKLVNTLLIVSFSFAFLNLPYFFGWLFYYLNRLYGSKHESEIDLNNFLFSTFKITEIFFIFNYSIKFFIYCASGTMFRERLFSVVNRLSTSLTTNEKRINEDYY